MPITINGSGTIGGISVGGLPDGIVDTDTLATSSVTTTKTSFTGDLAFNSGYGSAATAYGCRAWVNFNGTGTVAIRDDGNVSSITDNGTGDYTVNFSTAMPDANYAVAHTAGTKSVAWGVHLCNNSVAPTTSAYRFFNVTPQDTNLDSDRNSLTFFR